MRTFHLQPKIAFENLAALERRGLYEQALAELKEVWNDTSEPPDTKNYSPLESAEMVLRCGSLIGFHGHNKQILGAQERSKNLLTEARQVFLESGNIEKTAECENYLALAYWRTGELNEAETFVAEALSHSLPNSCKTRLYSYLINQMVFLAFSKFDELIADAATLESDFRHYGDDFLNGSFCTNVGLALKNSGETAKALRMFELARYYHQKSRHQIYLGTVENNLAQIYKTEKQFVKAHEAANNATKTFRRIKDRTREGFSLDTKAQIYLAEKSYAEALQTIEKAVQILEKSENTGFLAETYLSKAKILLYSEQFTEAVLALYKAVKIVELNVGDAAVKNLIADFEAALLEKNNQSAAHLSSEISDSRLELILPAPLAHYTEIQAVRMTNTHFEKIGLPKNSLAVVAQVELERGDLAVVSEITTGAIVCGFYDAEFGIVCLEAKSGEPYLFDETEITVLGKIVGVCRSGETTDGKLNAEPLFF